MEIKSLKLQSNMVSVLRKGEKEHFEASTQTYVSQGRQFLV